MLNSLIERNFKTMKMTKSTTTTKKIITNKIGCFWLAGHWEKLYRGILFFYFIFLKLLLRTQITKQFNIFLLFCFSLIYFVFFLHLRLLLLLLLLFKVVVLLRFDTQFLGNLFFFSSFHFLLLYSILLLLLVYSTVSI